MKLCAMYRLGFLFILLFSYTAFCQGDLTADKNSVTYTSVLDVTAAIEKVSGKPIEASDNTYSITITVTNIRNTKGVIRFKFYDDSTPFPHDTGFLRIVVPKSEIKNGSFTATYKGFTSKNMAIALSDDENDNIELDMGWFFPKEGHAFSNYYHTAFRRPVYDDFDFLLNADKTVVMKMRYY